MTTQNIIPYGIKEYKNPNAKQGVVLLLGQMMAHEGTYNVFTNVEAMLQSNANCNILYVCLNNQYISQEELRHHISNFSRENTGKLTIISAMHGNHILPWEGHKTLFYPLSNIFNTGIKSWPSLVYSYLTGSFVKTSKILQMLADAVQDRPIDLLISSCQGNVVIEDAQSILPEGSTIMTLSSGSVRMPGLIMDAVERVLERKDEFTADSLFTELSYIDGYTEKAYDYYRNKDCDTTDSKDCKYSNWFELVAKNCGLRLFDISFTYAAYDFNPKKAINDANSKTTMSIVEYADELLSAYNDYIKVNHVNFADVKISKIIEEFCTNIYDKECYDRFHNILYKKAYQNSYTLSHCTSHHTESSYIGGTILDMLGKKESYSTDANCIAGTSDYMLILGFANYHMSNCGSNAANIADCDI